MLFVNKIGVSTPGMSAHSTSTLQASCKETEKKHETNSEADITNKKSPSKGFFSIPKPLKVLKTALTTAILSFAVFKSSALTQLGFIEIEKLFNRAASPTTHQKDITQKEAIPEELRTHLWGKQGLTTKSITQQKDNCQIIASLIASTFTQDGIKKLESIVEVTDYNLDKNNFYINFTVHMNGKSIQVSYKDLIDNIWQTNDPLAPHAIAYAIEKELAKNYLPNPSGYTALSSATFLTNKSHSSLKLSDLSNSSLVELLQQAPNEVIMVGTKNMYNYSRLPREKWVDVEHAYAVKGYKYENGQHLITLTAYKQEVTLTLEQLRESMITITAPTKSFKLFDEDTLKVYLLSLLALIAIRKAIKKLENKTQTSQTDLKLQPTTCQP